MADARDRDNVPQGGGSAPLGMGRAYGRDYGDGGRDQGFDGSWGQGYGASASPSDPRGEMDGRSGGVQTGGEAAFRSFEPAGEDIASDASQRVRYGGDANLDEGPHRGRGPGGWSRADAKIRDDVCERLAEDRLLDAREIEVDVQGGVVTLTGEVPGASDPRLAEMLARQAPGVTDVRRQLSVTGDPRPHGRLEELDRSGLGRPGSMSGNSVAGEP